MSHPIRKLVAGLIVFLTLVAASLRADDKDKGDKPKAKDVPPSPLSLKVPESIEDLRALEQQVQVVVKKVTPATVAVQIGFATGSGVIVSEDGVILTAGHVSGQPGRDAIVIFPNGKRVKAKTLGRNNFIDSGMIKISEEGKFPFVDMGKSSDLKKGQWVVAIGQPGGFRDNRTPVVRVGRVLNATNFLLQTDCTLVGGDSGGPLFNLDGKVIGIHSRIGNTIAENVHVPLNTFHETWDRLAKGESWGGQLGQAAIVTSLGGKVLMDKQVNITPKDPPDKVRENRFHQVIPFKMTPGFAYTIDLLGLNKKIDPYLRLEDNKGLKIAEDDDGAGNLGSRIVFKPTQEADYRVIVSTYEGPDVGPLKLVIRQVDLKDLFLENKVEVWPTVKLPRQMVEKVAQNVLKLGVALHVTAALVDKDFKPAANQEVQALWKNGKKKFKTDDQGVFRIPLLKQDYSDLAIEVPKGLRALVQLTDPLGNPMNVASPEKIASAGGEVILKTEGKITDADPKDKEKAGCFTRMHEIKLAAGNTYTFDMSSPDFDAFVRLEDPDGKMLAQDDDGAGNFNSRLVFRPQADGVYRIVATTCDPGQFGNYLLTVREKKAVEGKK